MTAIISPGRPDYEEEEDKEQDRARYGLPGLRKERRESAARENQREPFSLRLLALKAPAESGAEGLYYLFAH